MVTEAHEVSFCSACYDASNDMHFYLIGPSSTLRSRDLCSNFDSDLSRSIHTYFDASRWEKHDDVRIFALAFFFQKISAKKTHGHFWSFA